MTTYVTKNELAEALTSLHERFDGVERLIKDTRGEVADVALQVKALAEGSPPPLC